MLLRRAEADAIVLSNSTAGAASLPDVPVQVRHTSIVAIDAINFKTYKAGSAVPWRRQCDLEPLLRELHKAYVGFAATPAYEVGAVTGVATGAWGCGAFRGNTSVKAIVQWAATAVAGRPLLYHAFHDSSGFGGRLARFVDAVTAARCSVGAVVTALAQLATPEAGSGDSDDVFQAVLEAALAQTTGVARL